MDKNTKIKIRVPKAIYESIKAEMVKQEGENPFAKGKPEMKEEEEMQEDFGAMGQQAHTLMDSGTLQAIAAMIPVGVAGTALAAVFGPELAKKLKGMIGKKGGDSAPKAGGEMEEAVDINTLMEALKDVKKKKDAEKKKKEAEDKKKAEEKKKADEKKKKEAEAKKKAAAANKK